MPLCVLWKISYSPTQDRLRACFPKSHKGASSFVMTLKIDTNVKRVWTPRIICITWGTLGSLAWCSTCFKVRVMVWHLFRWQEQRQYIPPGQSDLEKWAHTWKHLEPSCSLSVIFQGSGKLSFPIGGSMTSNPKAGLVQLLQVTWKLWTWREMSSWHAFLITISWVL